MSAPATVEEAGAAVTLQIRPDLRVSLVESQGQPYYVVEDPLTSQFYRVGVTEWEFARHLDGRRSVTDVAEQLAATRPSAVLSPEELELLCRWLVSARLVHLLDSTGNVAEPSSIPIRPLAKSDVQLNPFFMRFPLGSPDRWLSAALPKVRWLVGWHGLIVWIAFVTAAGWVLSGNWSEFSASARVYLSPQSWIWLWAVWLLLKLVHEFFHGLVCKKFGGYVGDSGVAMFLFSPVAFVDVTSAWHFRSKWHRIFTSVAGMYVELFLAALATLVWSYTDNATLRHFCHAVVFAAGLSTVLFNANPLMRFDGYYILSDWLGIPNLYARGQQYVMRLRRRIYLGDRHQAATMRTSRWNDFVVAIYGIMALAWRWVVCASLTIAASVLFQGAGLLLALFGMVIWLGKPILDLAGCYLGPQQLPAAQRRRLAGGLLLTGLVLTILVCLPRPGGISAPAIVAYADSETVRSELAGFVETVLVEDGEFVQPGQALLRIRSADLLSDLAAAEYAVEESRIRARSLHRDEELAKYQAERVTLAALEGRLKQLRQQERALLIKSPIAGSVVARNLATLGGRHVDAGEDLMVVANEGRKEIQASVSEQYVDSFMQAVGHSTRVRVQGRVAAFDGCTLTNVEPRASEVLRHAALGGPFGGPLPVESVEESLDQAPEANAKFKLVRPRFHAVITLPSELAETLSSGQLARVRLQTASESWGRWLQRGISAWVERKRQAGRSV